MMLKSHAKINLTLDILGKREDGYHELETVFQQLELHDKIFLKELNENKIEIECNVKDIENNNNLAYKAALLLKNRFAIKKGVRIKINKKIPIGGGLSGGSSNAAVVLKGLNGLWNLKLNEKELISISSEIGMDVAFHILGGTCLGKGRGEKIEKIKSFPKHYVIVVFPGFSISTKEAYDTLDNNQIGKKKSTQKFIKNYDLSYLHNDFEFSILKKYQIIKDIKNDLGKNSLLSGSGSCVFGLYKEKKEAEEIYEKIKQKYKEAFLTHTL